MARCGDAGGDADWDTRAAGARTADPPDRAVGLRRLSAMVGLDELTDEDLAGFQPDVREAARELCAIYAPRRPATRRRDAW